MKFLFNLDRAVLFQRYVHQRQYSAKRQKLYFKDPINPNESKFNKILIANRGEIACRVMKTAKDMGIKTVAVYSIADHNALHVKLADEAICIGPPLVRESYLNMDKILDAVKVTGAEAVHPGYGFLSENSDFVNKLDQNGVSFIGPSVSAIKGMGDKLESKRLAKEAGVNTIPGYDGIIKDEEHCIKIATEVGYPVMIKASAGGGGKGMRIANNDTEAKTAFKLCTEEALSSFGDDRMLIEKFINKPRHIEIQVLGDKHGNAIHLNERECSIQRRNQKVIEEAPSTFLDEETRAAMGQQAVSLCKKLGYYSAGTVEFLVDENRNFYFLEMNTRLQVEHPITECITGVDLVHQMIRIAKGHPLTLKQNDISIKGWAIENRVYAEDPYKNFGLPSIGTLYKYIEPLNLSGIRCDSGIEEGTEISIYYDPMICKLVAHGKSRNEAIAQSIAALDHYVIRGVIHNIPLLRDILTEPKFVSGDITTNYLNEVYPNGFKGKQINIGDKMELVATVACFYALMENNKVKEIGSDRQKIDFDLAVKLEDVEYHVIVETKNGYFEVKMGNDVYKVKSDFNLSTPVLKTSINNQVVVMQMAKRNSTGEIDIIYKGTKYPIRIEQILASKLRRLMPTKVKKSLDKSLVAPMPGLVKQVNVKSGDTVVEGQELCVIEAMKMQNSLSAAISGVIKLVNIKPSDTVGEGDILVEFQ